MARRTFIIKKRILENGNLWGVVAETNGQQFTIKVDDLLSMLVVAQFPFVVDYPHADKPATLTAAHKLRKDGMSYHFKTIGDNTTRNNFSKVKAISVNSRLPKRLK